MMLFGISLTFVEGEAVSVDSAAGSLHLVLSLLASMKHPFIFGFLVLYYWKIVDRHLLLLFALLVGISVIEIVTIGSKSSIIRGIVIVVLLMAVLPIRPNFKQGLVVTTALLVFYASFLVITEYRSIMLREYEAGRNVFRHRFAVRGLR
ncbi:MAG: hypothetical protein IPO57_09105 [Rhodocyclales bacterium]|nr:hypothetical protein [Rhodocyclales bacterium]